MAACLVLEDIQNSSQWMHTLVGSRSNLHLNCGDAKSRLCAGAAILTSPGTKVRFRGHSRQSRRKWVSRKTVIKEEREKKEKKEKREKREERKESEEREG